MSGGYTYGEPEPKERCPYCNALCCAWASVADVARCVAGRMEVV